MEDRSAQLVLASRSPRRAELLRQLQLTFRVHPVDCDESVRAGESAEALVRRLAVTKAELAAPEYPTLPTLGADTIVVIDGEVLGKPASPGDALTMLERLSGRAHQVLTAVAVCGTEHDREAPSRTEVVLSRSTVWFHEAEREQLEHYRATGEGMDKAGGYGIQGVGGILVRRIEGSHSGIMGLPIYETETLLRAFGVDTWQYRNSG